MEPLGWLLLILLGAWAALDGVSVGQFMISRPLVTGTVTGLVLGDPATGFLLGLILDLFHLGAIPAGGARLPEPGPAAIPAIFSAIWVGGAGGLAAGFCVGVALALAGGAAVIAQRRGHGRLVAGLADGGTHPGGLTRRLVLALGLDGLRGSALVAVGLAAVWAVPRGWHEAWVSGWPLGETATWALLMACAALPLGSVMGNLSAQKGRVPLLLAGLAVGVVLGFWWELP